MHVVASLFSNMHFTRTHVIVLLVLLQETVASIPRHNVPMIAKTSVLRPARHSLPFMSKPRWDTRPPSLLRFRRNGPEVEKRRLGKWNCLVRASEFALADRVCISTNAFTHTIHCRISHAEHHVQDACRRWKALRGTTTRSSRIFLVNMKDDVIKCSDKSKIPFHAEFPPGRALFQRN